MAGNLIKTLLFTVVVPGTFAGYIPYRILGPGPYAVERWAWLGSGPLAAGLLIYLWCAWDFASAGRGTPLPLDAPKKLVVRGLYRFVRNPMYVGVLLVISGQALLFRSWNTLGYAGFVALAFHSFVILYEEPALGRRFGLRYEEYRRTVPRWLPRLTGGYVCPTEFL